jgi:hypothetical protein
MQSMQHTCTAASLHCVEAAVPSALYTLAAASTYLLPGLWRALRAAYLVRVSIRVCSSNHVKDKPCSLALGTKAGRSH